MYLNYMLGCTVKVACKCEFTPCHVNVNNCQLWLQAVRIKKHTLINPSKNIVQLYTTKISVPFLKVMRQSFQVS